MEQIWIGTILLALGTWLLIRLDTSSPLVELIFFQIITGVGSAILFEPPLIALHSMVMQEDTASGTAMIGFIRNIAMAISIVVGGAVFENSMKDERMALQHAGLMDEELDQLTGVSAISSPEMMKSITHPAKVRIVADAFSASLRNTWIMYTCVAGCGTVVGAFIVKRSLSAEHTETRTGLKNE